MIADYAIVYARSGLRVFPCHHVDNRGCSCPKGHACESPGKHPRVPRGSKEATTDEEQIREWWERWPGANIAIATGGGVLAIDVDRRQDKDGMLWLSVHRSELPDTVEQVTPSGGRHLLYRYDPSLWVRNNTDSLCRGVDVRGEGGYVMAEPSSHTLGQYMWQDAPSEHELAQAPEWLLERIASTHTRERMDGAKKWRVSSALSQDKAEEIRSALQYIDADDRTTWLRMGMAIHSEYANEAGYTLWSEWSQSSAKFDEEVQRHTWNHLDSYGGVTLASLFGAAQENGWVYLPNAPAVDELEAYTAPDVAGDFPVELLERGRVGLLRELCLWIDGCAHKAQPVLSLVASLSALGALYGRGYETASGLRTNLYTMGIAPSGAGKDNARQCLKNLLHKADAGELVGPEYIGSGVGLVESLEAQRVQVLFLDEIAGLVARLGPRANAWDKDIAHTLMTLSGTASSQYTGRAVKGRKAVKISQPHLCFYGTTTPEVYDRLQSEDAVSGFLNRILLFPVSFDVPPDRERDASANRPPQSLVEYVRDAWRETQRIANGGAGNMSQAGMGEPQPLSVPDGDGVKGVWAALGALAAQAKSGGVQQELWSRCREQAMRLALIRALARYQMHPEVSRDDAQWGADVASWCVGRLAHDCEERISSSQHGADVNKVLRIVRGAPDGYVKRSELTLKTKDMARKRREEAIAYCIETEQIAKDELKTKGRPAIIYRATRPVLRVVK